MASPSHLCSSSTVAAGPDGQQRFTIVAPSPIVLPTRFADAAFLHVLVTHPESLIPPGKSLRAALLRPEGAANANEESSGNAPESLQSAVEKIVHRAFWDEAGESLSDTEPSKQIARLRLLYKDLYTALEGLLPKSHPSYVRLADPLSPTPAPLQSARNHLLELTTALQERCAPARDAQLSSIRSVLENGNASDLPSRLVQAIKQILEVSVVMKKDLSNAILGAVKDDDLEKEILRMARVEERRAILEIYGAKSIKDRWKSWLSSDGTESNSGRNENDWVRRLVMALGADVPISCLLPSGNSSASETPSAPPQSSGSSNEVPPIFALSSSDLFHIQNHIQALVIVAVLRTLVPHPRSTFTSSSFANISAATSSPSNAAKPLFQGSSEEASETRTFADRVLSLLMIEVDETSEDAGTTKLINLADEVLREHRRLQAVHAASSSEIDSSPLPPIDEQTIRSRVDALLKPSNPVFILLRKRLLDTLADSLIYALQTELEKRERDDGRRLPEAIKTGREMERQTKRPRLNFSYSGSSGSESDLDLKERGHLRRLIEEITRSGRVQTKGYEDPVLARGMGEVLGELSDVVEWVRDTWADRGFGLEGLDRDVRVTESDADEAVKGKEKEDGPGGT
ncbi:hypothetical protein ACEPAH_9563 [Sanghuangporus vaninii]